MVLENIVFIMLVKILCFYWVQKFVSCSHVPVRHH